MSLRGWRTALRRLRGRLRRRIVLYEGLAGNDTVVGYVLVRDTDVNSRER